MYRKTHYKVTRWPTPQDYNEAVQNLHVNMNDAELEAGQIETDPLGLPRPMTGAFCSVYRVKCATRDWAVRCFLREIPDVQWRYEEISQFVMHDSLTYTVGFEFQPKGMMVGGLWYPILKMEWVDGQTLDNYLRSHYSKLDRSFAETFKRMTKEIGAAGIAHGDLQHGNIMVHLGQLFLIDYDGMFVPSMKGSGSNELGHRNYQHPRRKPDHFGPFLDNFSAWVIYTSLRALSIDPSLWDTLGSGEDCLLFRQEDYRMPRNSCAFNVLENHHNEEIRRLARIVRWWLLRDPSEVPDLDAEVEETFELPSLTENVPKSRAEQGAESASQVVIQRSWREGEDANSSFVNRPFIEYELRTKALRKYKVVDTALKLEMRLVHPPLAVRCELVARGTPAQAEITARDRMGTEWWLSYSYYDEKREQIKIGGMAVSKAEYESVEVGDKLTVLYFPGTDDRVLYKFAGVKTNFSVSAPKPPAPRPTGTANQSAQAGAQSGTPLTRRVQPVASSSAPTITGARPQPRLVVTPAPVPIKRPAPPSPQVTVASPQPSSAPVIVDPSTVKFTPISVTDERELERISPPRAIRAKSELVAIDQYADKRTLVLCASALVAAYMCAVDFFPGVLLCCGLIVFASMFWYLARGSSSNLAFTARQLAAYGTYATGQIISKTLVESNNWTIDYEYSDNTGAKQKRQVSANSAEAGMVSVGENVAVLYNNSAEVLYCFCPYEIIGSFEGVGNRLPNIALVDARRTRFKDLATFRVGALAVFAILAILAAPAQGASVVLKIALSMMALMEALVGVSSLLNWGTRRVLSYGKLAFGTIEGVKHKGESTFQTQFWWIDQSGTKRRSTYTGYAVGTPGQEIPLFYDPTTKEIAPVNCSPWELY